MIVSKRSIKFRYLILVGAILVAFAPVFVSAASLTDLTELQKQRQAAIQQAAQKQKDAEAIQKIISQIDKDIANTQYRINKTQNEIDNLTKQIAQKEQELAIEQENQNEAIRVMYETTNQNTLEILIGSETLSEVVTYGEYLEALEIKIENTIAEIERLKKDLEQKRGDLQKLETQLQAQLNSLANQRNQKNNLLNMTLAEKRQYLDEADKLKNDIARISEDLYRQRLAAGGIITGGDGGYPFSAIDVPDPWLFLTRECTSYAAWYWNAILGKRWYNTQPGRGSATYWDEIAHTLGYTISSTPQINAFVVWKSGPLTSVWGHVAIVEAVNDNGRIDISEYNWVQYSYSRRVNINPTAYGTYVYIY